jgi:hypothetical protein
MNFWRKLLRPRTLRGSYGSERTLHTTPRVQAKSPREIYSAYSPAPQTSSGTSPSSSALSTILSPTSLSTETSFMEINSDRRTRVNGQSYSMNLLILLFMAVQTLTTAT